MTDLVTIGKALADASRVRVLQALRAGELCVCELCDALEVTQSTLSTHLQVIRKAGLVSTRKEGKWVYYSLTPESRPTVETIFGLFDKSLKADPKLKRDAKKLERRLSLRNSGSCCLGFAAKRNRCR